ncbi:hypothetical protein LOD99_3818 [Oopsacas minuta]|uniref:Uncharacterized protein n=1 Tax=Oopsacas minuta TaxID=111878 RepID=A0AAV7JWK8_9METZ|nr:hypothetical protein LOD99_3818 [Oopsacas minuta]
MAKADKQLSVDEEFISNVDSKIYHLKEQVKKDKVEINEKFRELIQSILQCQENVLERMDDTLHEAISEVTNQTIEITKLSANKENFKSVGNVGIVDEIQNQIQDCKLHGKYVPEIHINWKIEPLTKELGELCQIEPTNHPYAYLGEDLNSIKAEGMLKSVPTSFEIDARNGDVYLLCNEDSENFDFRILVVDKLGKSKFDRKLERKFCPVGMCVGENSFFVSTSGGSAKAQMDSHRKELPVDTEIQQYQENILKFDKENGKMENFPITDVKEIGLIAYEPKSKSLFLLTGTKNSPILLVFDSETISRKASTNLELRSGYISSAPKIQKIEIFNENVILFYDKSKYIDVYDLEGRRLSFFPDGEFISQLTTSDAWGNILAFNKKSNVMKIMDKNHKLLSQSVIQLDCDPIDLKFNISTHKVLCCGLVKESKLNLVHLYI